MNPPRCSTTCGGISKQCEHPRIIFQAFQQEPTMSEAAFEAALSTHPLDDAIWRALSGKQNHLALGDARAWRYPSAVTAFGALADSSDASFDALRALIAEDGPVALVTTNTFDPPPGFAVLRRGDVSQMVWQGNVEAPPDVQYVTLTQDDVPDMLALTAATQPGPFGPRTIELGRYIGVRMDGKLVAMAGERTQLDGFTEISAICVDPVARGRGYAASLTKLLIAAIVARGDTPYLHVFTSNEGAIALYRKLGFVERRVVYLTVLGLR
jgi:predicted GNAT family acetyltransferase